MSSAPVRYRHHERPKLGAACELCGDVPGRPVVDHCHLHEWVRGVLCARCNSAMSFVDRRVPPVAAIRAGATLETLIAFAQRCPDCPAIDPAEFSILRRVGVPAAAFAPATDRFASAASEVARQSLRAVVDNAQIHRKPTVITRHGLTAAVVIPPEWFEELLRYRAADGHDDSTSSR